MKCFKHALMLVLSGLVACGSSGDDTSGGNGTEPQVNLAMEPVSVVDQESGLGDKWFKQGAFIEIFVRAYHDGNGDGIGDLKGVTQKLDYLKEMGITGIWLMPINPSFEHDHGYSVDDYRQVETEYGSLADMQELISEAHKRGIGIIIDYVANHSSASNPLFINSQFAPTATYRNWYIWRNDKPTDWVSYSGINPWHAAGGSYYYGVFWEKMPDFNLRNPEVIAYHKDNMRFWLNLGVDGFRFDAVETLLENGPGWDKQFSQLENYALLRELRQVLNSYKNRYMVCEAPSTVEWAASELGCKSAFAFNVNEQIRDLARGTTTSLAQVAQFPLRQPIGQLAIMLSNHDRFAGLRLMDEVNGDETAYRLAATSYLTLPGVPFLYYGEEVGMQGMPVGNFSSSSDWPVRGPMSWATTPSVTKNTRLGNFSYFAPSPNISSHNVASAQQDSNSLMNFYKSLLNFRKGSSALTFGDYRLLSQIGELWVFERRSATESVVVAMNYGTNNSSAAVTGLDAAQTYSAALVVGASGNGFITDVTGAAPIMMPPRSAQVFRTSLTDQAIYRRGNLYVRGSMNNWVASAGNQLSYQGNARYSVTLNLPEAKTYTFKIASADGSGYQFGGATWATASSKNLNVSNNAVVELEQTAWHSAGSADDVELTVPTAGNYTFMLDASDALSPRLQVVKQ